MSFMDLNLSIENALKSAFSKMSGQREYAQATPDYVDRIIVNGDVTIVFWKDETKTVVKRSPETEYSLYNAFTAALAEKFFGSNSRVHRILERKTLIQNPRKNRKTLIQNPHKERKSVIQNPHKERKSVIQNPYKGNGKQAVNATKPVPRLKLGDRVSLANPEREDAETVALFKDNNVIVIPEDENGMVCVLVGNRDGLRRVDINAERLVRYD